MLIAAISPTVWEAEVCETHKSSSLQSFFSLAANVGCRTFWMHNYSEIVSDIVSLFLVHFNQMERLELGDFSR